ncbi:hypothetical protein [Vineibacter terrae]|nr:hypothetical protein [Vineibacter terrae]
MGAPQSLFDQWWAERVAVQHGALVEMTALLRDWLAWCGKRQHMPGLGSVFMARVGEQQGVAAIGGTDWLTGLQLRRAIQETGA